MTLRPTEMPPIAGALTGNVVEAVRIAIHGDVYYDLVLLPSPESATAVRVRTPMHVCAREPVVGDRVTVRLLMQQVTGLDFN